MFKQGFLEGASEKFLKGNAKRALAQQIANRINIAVAADPNKPELPSAAQLLGDSVLERKLKGSRQVVYVSKAELDPLIVDIDGRGTLMPTLQGMWKVPGMLPPMIINEHTSKFIFNGADVMWPGVLSMGGPAPNNNNESSGSDQTERPPPANPAASFECRIPSYWLPPGPVGDTDGRFWVTGQKRALYVAGNPLPFAVGEMLSSSSNHTGSGKAMKVLHLFGDGLWAASQSPAAPEGFSRTGVAPLIDVWGRHSLDTADESQFPALGAAPVAKTTTTTTTTTTAASASSSSLTEGSPAPAPEATPWTQDELLLWSFSEALTSSVKESDLPMLASTFYAKHVLAAVPVGRGTLNVKGTKWKKFGPFMADMVKEGVVGTTEDKPGELKLVKFDKGADMLKEHRKQRTAEGRAPGEGTAAAAAAAAAAAEETGPATTGVQVQLWYRPSSRTQSIWIEDPADAKRKRLYTAKEARSVLEAYLSSTAQRGNKPSEILIDQALSLVWSKMDRPKVGASVARALVAKEWSDSLTILHTITGLKGVNDTLVRKGPPKSVIVTTAKAKGHQGKSMTLVQGLEAFGVEPKTVAEAVRGKFAASATVQPCMTKGSAATAKEVMLQGDHMAEVADWISEVWSIPRKFIDLVQPKGAKKKKR